jgi:hypothetical protein
MPKGFENFGADDPLDLPEVGTNTGADNGDNVLELEESVEAFIAESRRREGEIEAAKQRLREAEDDFHQAAQEARNVQGTDAAERIQKREEAKRMARAKWEVVKEKRAELKEALHNWISHGMERRERDQ